MKELPDPAPSLDSVVALSRSLGSHEKDLAILAEGNVSAIRDQETFWVKASGTQMASASERTIVPVRFAPILEALKLADASDGEIKEVLADSRSDPSNPLKPSVETFMHAALLQLPGVFYVGHTHPTPLLSLLCVADAEQISKLRLFPDEVVCCGPESAFVAYSDPGIKLAKEIQSSIERYGDIWGSVPKTIWLQNHGLIALGGSASEVESATFMATKAARVWVGALSTHRELKPMSPSQVARIHTRPDEHYRQRQLWQLQKESNPIELTL